MYMYMALTKLHVMSYNSVSLRHSGYAHYRVLVLKNLFKSGYILMNLPTCLPHSLKAKIQIHYHFLFINYLAHVHVATAVCQSQYAAHAHYTLWSKNEQHRKSAEQSAIS